MSRGLFNRLPVALLLLSIAIAVVGCSAAGPVVPPAPSPPAEQPLRIAGTAKALALLRSLADAYRLKHPEAVFQFDSGIDSTPAVREVGDGSLDLAIISRPLTPEEAAIPVAGSAFVRDAIVFATNSSVSLPGLSSAQIRDIYGGVITSWQQVGGPAASIIVFDREASDSGHLKVAQEVLQGKPIAARTVVYNKSNDLLDALDTTPNALGFSQLGLLQSRRSRSVRILAMDGVTPAPDTVAQGTYPWHMPFYLVHNENRAPQALRAFLEFAYGSEGKRIIQENGYGALAP